MIGFPIGSWDFPSGNRVSVSLDQENGSGVRSLRCAWERFPPLKEGPVLLPGDRGTGDHGALV